MNVQIKKLDLDNLWLIDIETIIGNPDFGPESDEWEEFRYLYRDKDTDELPSETETLKLYLKNAPVIAEFAEIACISIGRFTREGIETASFFVDGENYLSEADILEAFIAAAKEENVKLAGHNVIGFDLPMIRQRFMLNGLINKLDYLSVAQGNDAGKKPWHLEDNVIDTMVIWKGTGFKNTSLGRLLQGFGLATSKDDIRGSEVTKTWFSGEEGRLRVVKYGEKDTGAVGNLLLKWRGEKPLPIISLTFGTIRDAETGEEHEVEGGYESSYESKALTLFEQLAFVDEIDGGTEDKLRGFLAEVEKGDLINVGEVLKSIYLRNYKESAPNKLRREKEIDELIEEFNG